jgi:tripartite ATP-independent transporter DctM subunit
MNVPVAVCITIATMLTIFSIGSISIDSAIITAEKIATGIDSFSLLAIPFFIISGLIMGRGGMARRLIDFASSLVGRFPGGLGYVNVVTCMLFGAISGSAAAAVSSLGGFMIPEMTKKGYDRDFNIAVTSTAATTGLLIPPSNVMIVYSLALGGSVSIAALFVAGIVPGIVCGLTLMVVSGYYSVKHGYGSGEKASFSTMVKSFLGAAPSLALIIVVIGGIVGGFFSATEASAVAVVYSLILSVFVYKEVKIKELPDILLQSGISTSIVMLLIGASSAMSWILASQNIPQELSSMLMSISDNRYVILMIVNILLLFIGTFMDMTPAILIFTPILMPVMQKIGISPLHFGIIMITNLCIGLCTPPVGTCLFLGCSVGNGKIAQVAHKMIPFFIAMAVALLAITYMPMLSEGLPRLFGLIK